ncbi:Polyamine oxidase 1 [Linum perenne]
MSSNLISTLLLLILLQDALSASASPSHSVIIVGAGMSGIMAAKTLHDAGIKDILILEATSRIGGRMKKAEIGGYTVELGANWIPETPLERLIDYYHNDFEDADPPQISSLRNIFPRSESADDGPLSHFVADSRGFEVVVKYLAKQFLSSLTNDPRIRLNKVVRKIMYNDAGVEVMTEDGTKYRSKYVIVSVSLGVLQSDLIEFRPVLPMWKRIAIADFSMTVYTKIFLKFPYKFWPTGPGTEFFLYTHIQHGYYPIWQHLENVYPGSNILLVTVHHDESRRIEQLADEAVVAEAMSVLRNMFGDDIPEAESVLVPKWWSDRFYKGSYSNWPDGYSRKRHSHLQAAVGRVYFTGEHTHERYFGWVPGAYLAGIATAKNLMGTIEY